MQSRACTSYAEAMVFFEALASKIARAALDLRSLATGRIREPSPDSSGASLTDQSALIPQGLFSILRHDGADDGGLGHAHAHKLAAERDCGGRSARPGL